jgi:hypothetical protein
MVTFLLRDLPDGVGERERVREVRELERAAQPRDAVDLDELPVGDLRAELRDLVGRDGGDRRSTPPAYAR